MEKTKGSVQECMMTEQYSGCILGLLLGIPLSVRRKSYAPFAILGVLGSIVDYSIPYEPRCVELQQQVKKVD